MGSGVSAANIKSLREHEQVEVIERCAILYASDPIYFEFIVAEAKKKTIEHLSSPAKKSESVHDAPGQIPPSTELANAAESKTASYKELAPQESKHEEEKTQDKTAAPSATGVRGNSLDLISVINRVRMSPPDFVEEIEKHMSKFIDETVFQLKVEGKTINIRTNEGKAAVVAAIEFLKGCPPVAPINYSPLLEKAAVDHATDIFVNKVSGHEGSDGSTMVTRVEKYGSWSGSIAENIDMGNSNALDVITALIIDDGVPNRGHRNNLFDPALRFAGSAIGPHSDYDHVCVIDFAGDIKDLQSIVQDDVTISCKGTDLPEEFQKVLQSIPMQKVTDDVMRELSIGNEVEIDYSFARKSAEVRFISKTTKRTMKLKWGPGAAAGTPPVGAPP